MIIQKNKNLVSLALKLAKNSSIFLLNIPKPSYQRLINLFQTQALPAAAKPPTKPDQAILSAATTTKGKGLSLTSPISLSVNSLIMLLLKSKV
ncbi:MAG: hypothetical protein P8Q37_02095 [Porticoccaceae bacterium]|nr:hypothetical protein [Porticoccaceae bacterium]